MSALAFRLAEMSDLPFIYGSWLDSFRLSHSAGVVPMDCYRDVYTDAINRLLSRPTCDVLVAYMPGESAGLADLHGFLCGERTSRGPIIHFCYTKETRRRLGVARGMFEAAGFDLAEPFTFTYKTPVLSKPWCRSKISHAKYDPLCARFETAWQEDR